jgi:hypothetical protein
MNKTVLFILLVLTLMLSACGGNASSAGGPAASGPGRGAAGELSAPMQVALGTIKLDGTKNAVTAEQAKELLPLWETLQDLEGSDTAATQEKEALVSQIQESMTQEQTQAITALNLSRQDMISIMQSQVQTVGGSQNGTTQRGGTSANGRRNFGGGAGGFFVGGGGPPPDGGFAGGNPNAQRQGQQQGAQSGSTTANTNQPAAIDPNRIPTPLIQAVIEYLKTKASA